MIRVQDPTPEWIYWFAGKVPELSEAAKKAKCLALPRQVTVDIERPMETYWSDGYFFDPYKPIHVPGQEKRTVRVEYAERKELYKFRDLWQQVKLEWGIDEWTYVYPEQRWDYDTMDPRYHIFRVGELEMYYMKVGSTEVAFLFFRNLEDAQWYATHTILMNVNNTMGR